MVLQVVLVVETFKHEGQSNFKLLSVSSLKAGIVKRVSVRFSYKNSDVFCCASALSLDPCGPLLALSN